MLRSPVWTTAPASPISGHLRTPVSSPRSCRPGACQPTTTHPLETKDLATVMAAVSVVFTVTGSVGDIVAGVQAFTSRFAGTRSKVCRTRSATASEAARGR